MRNSRPSQNRTCGFPTSGSSPVLTLLAIECVKIMLEKIFFSTIFHITVFSQNSARLFTNRKANIREDTHSQYIKHPYV